MESPSMCMCTEAGEVHTEPAHSAAGLSALRSRQGSVMERVSGLSICPDQPRGSLGAAAALDHYKLCIAAPRSVQVETGTLRVLWAQRPG